MTNSQKMIWAAVFAQSYLAGIDWSMNAGHGSDETLFQDAAADASEVATSAVMALSDAQPTVLEMHGAGSVVTRCARAMGGGKLPGDAG